MLKSHYIVLSRKYRPKYLDDLIGQENIAKSIRNCIDNKRIPHAFLLHGIRGVGKTTTARIIARCLNCLGKDGTTFATSSPCGFCKSCVALDGDRHMDVIEVDAASRTGVEDIREIIEATQYTPVLGRFKVFIIDEVHMISKSAFNALLKTLEEPPDHVKFVFATTELNKIPETILSRCMIFDLKRVQKSVVCDHLVSTAAKEGFSLDNGAVDVIAEESGGSLRDSLSMLEQAMMLSFQSKKIDYDSVVKMIGGCPLGDCISLIRAVLSANIASAFEKTEFLIMNGASPFAIFKKLQDLIYKLITVKVAKVSDIPQLKDLSQDISLSNLLYLWQILMKQIPNMKNTDHADNVLKAIVIILAHTASFPSIEDLMIKEDENLVAAIKDKFPGSVVTPL